MKKICYVVTVPLTIRAFFIPQLQCLAKNGFDVTVICSFDEELQHELGSNVRYIPVEIPRGIAFRNSIKAITELEQIFREENFELVQFSTPNAALYASIAAKKAGIARRNYHLMGFRFLGADGVGRIILKTLEKISCKNSTSIECVSKSNYKLGIKEGIFPKSKACVVWNGSTGGINIQRFDFRKRGEWRKQIRSELGYKDGDFVYGYVGRITRDKGINELLTAFLSIQDDSKLFLIGDLEGEDSLDLKVLKKANENANVQFHTRVRDIERYYAAMDVLVFPSYREGFGNVVIEAGAVGTPAIVSDIPGPIDTVDRDVTAFIVPVKNALALRDAMKKIRTIDYVKMGLSAAEYAREHFDSDVLNQKILERKIELLRS